MSLVARGVWARSYLTPEGRTVLVAIDANHCEVGSLVLEPDDNYYKAAQELWDLLDLADPENARRSESRLAG